jgi:protein transport protein SEC24
MFGRLAGLRISDHFGNFFQRNITDLEFGTIDADKAIAARIKHESKLDEKTDAYFQCAALYTSASGQRRVRVHNIAVPVTSLVNNVFRYADMDTTIAVIAKESITQTNNKSLRVVREILTESCVKTLLAYRKHCASSTSPAQVSALSRSRTICARIEKFTESLSLRDSSFFPNLSNSSRCTLSLS